MNQNEEGLGGLAQEERLRIPQAFLIPPFPRQRDETGS